MQSETIITNSVGISFSCIRMLIGAFSVIYLLSKGISISELGWIKAFQGVVLVFIDIPLSYYSDKYSRKLSIILAILFSTVWLIITGLGSNFWHFLLAEFFNALSLGLMSGTFSAYLYDISRKNDPSNTAINIFSKYQRNTYFMMAIFSFFGVIGYHYLGNKIWLISSLLMSIVFILSLFLPSDNEKSKDDEKNLLETLIELLKIFSTKNNSLFVFLYTSLLLSVALQVIIQYWQILISPLTNMESNKIYYGIAFSLILISQSLSGHTLNKIKSIGTLVTTIIVSAAIPFILFYFEKNTPYISIISICCIFFSMSLLCGFCSSKLAELVPDNIRSTTFSSSAVASKLLTLFAMPLSSYLISLLGIKFNILTCLFILIMTFISLRIIKSHPI